MDWQQASPRTPFIKGISAENGYIVRIWPARASSANFILILPTTAKEEKGSGYPLDRESEFVKWLQSSISFLLERDYPRHK